jgi:PBP1b-binding outer membrane lipoprotein LpoB
MKKTISTTVSLIALVLIVLTVSGCAVRAQRLENAVTTAPSQPTTAPATVETSSGMIDAATEDVEGQELLDLVNTLDAENQAGDSLEDLP